MLRLVDRMCAHGRTLCMIWSIIPRSFAEPDRSAASELVEVTPRWLRCGDCCHRPDLFRLAGFPSELRTAPEGSVRRRKVWSHPIWGRSEAIQSGGVLLAPLPRECKSAGVDPLNAATERHRKPRRERDR